MASSRAFGIGSPLKSDSPLFQCGESDRFAVSLDEAGREHPDRRMH